MQTLRNLIGRAVHAGRKLGEFLLSCEVAYLDNQGGRMPKSAPPIPTGNAHREAVVPSLEESDPVLEGVPERFARLTDLVGNTEVKGVICGISEQHGLFIDLGIMEPKAGKPHLRLKGLIRTHDLPRHKTDFVVGQRVTVKVMAVNPANQSVRLILLSVSS
jgi:hypothetical protein